MASCDGVRADPNAEFRDGRYVAAYENARADGWRPFVELRVRAGRLHSICFDATLLDGTRMLESERYLEEYRLANNVDLGSYLSEQIEAVLASQALHVTASAEAVEWSFALFDLLSQVIPAARVGLTVDDAGVALVATNEPYVATDPPDELGWSAALLAVYFEGSVVAADYREASYLPDGTIAAKRDDPGYQSDYERLVGTTNQAVADELVTGIIQGNVPDAITGATITADRFSRLAAVLEARRATTTLPERPCR